MTHSPLHVLVTRPQPDADKLAALIEEKGIKASVAPMMEISFLDDIGSEINQALAKRPQFLVITSANGTRALADATRRRDMTLVTVGDATAALAKRLGFTNVFSAQSGGNANAEILTQYIRSNFRAVNGRLIVHLCGSKAIPLGRHLAHEGFVVEPITLYAADRIDAFPPNVERALTQNQIHAVLFFSSRTAEFFVELMEEHGLNQLYPRLTAICLSQKIADDISYLLWHHIRSADIPATDAILRIVQEIQQEQLEADNN